MIRECKRHTLPFQHFQQLEPAAVELFCRGILPGMLFMFVTFEKEDYRRGNVTLVLYNYVTGNVCLSVETPLELEAAIGELTRLNPGVHWNTVTLYYLDHDDSGHAKVTVELGLSAIPMRISAGGQLVFK